MAALPNEVFLSHSRLDLVFADKLVAYDRYAGRIVPILYRPCDYRSLSWTLGALQMIDFTGIFEDGCRSLLRIWGIGYRE